MKIKNTFIRELVDVINLKGTPLDLGCSIDKAMDIREQAYRLSPDKPVCIVSGWSWMDIRPKDVKNSRLSDLQDELHPSFIVADNVIKDDIERFSPGSYIRTSLLVEFHPSCIFETENTNYILVGAGTRSAITIKKAESLFGKKGVFTD